MSNNKTNRSTYATAARGSQDAEIFGVSPSTPTTNFRSTKQPRRYTRRKVSFASLPLDIRHLFTQAEARSYMKDCQLSNLQLSKQTELALYMIEFHPRAFIHQEKTAIKDAACEMLKTLMSTHTPSFSGNIKDEIDLAFFYSLPNARRRQIKLTFRTKSPGYKCLSTLTPAEMATLANAKQFYVSPTPISATNTIDFRCRESGIAIEDLQSELQFRLDPFQVNVLKILRRAGTNCFVVTLSGEDPPYELLANPCLEVCNEKMALNALCWP